MSAGKANCAVCGGENVQKYPWGIFVHFPAAGNVEPVPRAIGSSRGFAFGLFDVGDYNLAIDVSGAEMKAVM